MALTKVSDGVTIGRRSLCAVDGGPVVSGGWYINFSILDSPLFLTLVSVFLQRPKEIRESLTCGTIDDCHDTALMKK